MGPARVLFSFALAFGLAGACQRTDVVRDAAATPCSAGHIAVMRALREKLFGNANITATLRDPALPASGPLPIDLHIKIHRVISLAPKTQTFTVDATVTHTFVDSRWCWDSQHWCSVTELYGQHVRTTDVWLPDTTIELGEIDTDFLHQQVRVDNTGRLTWNLRTRFTLHCEMNFRYFPFDRQTCNHRIGSSSYRSTDIRYSLSSPPLSLDEQLMIGTVDVYTVNTPHLRVVPETSGNPDNAPLLVTFDFRRERGRQVLNVFFPIWLVVGLSILGLFIDPKAAPARVTMAVVTVLVLINLQNRLADGLPNLAYTSAMDVFFVVCLLQTIANAGEYAVVNFVTTSLRDLKDDVAKRRNIRDDMKRAKHAVHKGEIGIGACSLALFERKVTGLEEPSKGPVIGYLQKGDVVLVRDLQQVPNTPGRIFARVQVTHSKADARLNGAQGTVLFKASDAADATILCDWQRTLAGGPSHAERQGSLGRRESLRRCSMTSTDSAFLTVPYGHDDEPHDAARDGTSAPPVSPVTVDDTEIVSSVVESSGQESGSEARAKKTRVERQMEEHKARTRAKKMAEIWEAFVLFLAGGEAAHEDDVVALLHHYAGIDPRDGQRWVDEASKGEQEDDMIDFDEFETKIVPRIIEREKRVASAQSGEGSRLMSSEPQALTFLRVFFMTESKIRRLEYFFRWIAIVYFFLFNVIFFTIVLVLVDG